jgi:hypothetical protein
MPNKNYPIRMNLDEISKNTAKKDKASRDAKALQKGAVARGNREQAREANELEMMRKKRKGMKCGGKVHKMAGGGGVYGPTDGGSGGGSGGSGGDYRLKDLGPAPSAGRGNTTIRPSLRGGMPGVKVKSKFSKGGKVNHKGCGIAKRGLTKGKMR